jgi:hypothetical protein
MGLLKVVGAEGARFYDTKLWTEAEAKQDYVDSTGEEPRTETHEFKFDVCTAPELIDFMGSVY